jgi:hypothetical protein
VQEARSDTSAGKAEGGDRDELGVARGPEREIQSHESRSDEIRGKHRFEADRLTLESDGVLLDGDDSVLGDLRLSVLDEGGDLDLLPLDGGLQPVRKGRRDGFERRAFSSSLT